MPGTIIHTDGWPSYTGLDRLGFVHRVVIHSDNFVDPVTGVNTNSVENYWQRCKRKLKWIYGVSQGTVQGHLDEFMWTERYGRTFSDRWLNTMKMLDCRPR